MKAPSRSGNITVHPTAAVDEDSELIAREPIAPKRRRGRPRGAVGKFLIAENGIQKTDLVFLRAVTEGVSPTAAAERYFGHRSSMDKRAAKAYVEELRDALQMGIKQLANADLQNQAQEALNVVLHEPAELASPDPTVSKQILPTLDEFIQDHGLDPDFFSEAELIEEYRSTYGVAPGGEADAKVGSPSSPPVEVVRRPVGDLSGSRMDKLTALAWLEDHLSKTPAGTDPCSHWIEPRLAHQFAAKGAHTLAELVSWMNACGARWYSNIERCGKTRARRLMQWLFDNEDHIGVALSGRFANVRSPALPAVTEVPQIRDGDGVGEISGMPLWWPRELDGASGEYRGESSNTLRANNDQEALKAWFDVIQTKSPATVDAYRRGIFRLVYWAVLERKRALSDLAQEDFFAFIEFLRNPPAHWIQAEPVMRSSSDWRPMRGPLGDESVRLTLVAVSRFYAHVHKAGYLRVNPVPSGLVQRKEVQMDVMRSFAEQHLEAVKRTLDAMPDGPRRRRLRAVILLLVMAGLRRAEASAATWGMVVETRIENRLSGSFHLDFLGKGSKQRRVPLHGETLQALRDHLEDRHRLVAAGVLPYANVEMQDTPLLSILDDRLTVAEPGPGSRPHDAPRKGNPNGALSTGRIHGLLKEFFARVASHQLDGVHGDPEMYLRASAHWLRHTFAHQVLAAKGDLRVVKELLGHASLSTTGIYTKADMLERGDAIAKLSPPV